VCVDIRRNGPRDCRVYKYLRDWRGASGEGWDNHEADDSGLLQLELHCDIRSNIIFVLILVLVHENSTVHIYHSLTLLSNFSGARHVGAFNSVVFTVVILVHIIKKLKN